MGGSARSSDGWGAGPGGWSMRESTYAYTWLVHAVVEQKVTQHCKAITLQLLLFSRSALFYFFGTPRTAVH